MKKLVLPWQLIVCIYFKVPQALELKIGIDNITLLFWTNN